MENGKKHPELKKGEVFLSNGKYSELKWKTKRQGVVAFDAYGNSIRGIQPVFVQKAELEAAGVQIDGRYCVTE